MTRILRYAAIPIVALSAFLLGLAGATLRTGRIDPLDWLLPGAVALILLLLLEPRASAARMARFWALLCAPVMLFCFVAGTGAPWALLAMLCLGLALIAGLGRVALRLALRARWGAYIALLAFALVAPRLADDAGMVPVGDAEKPLVGVMTAMPLQGPVMGAAHGLAPAESIGLRSPLWQALEGRLALRALDAIDEASLGGLSALLLAQPRLLTPQELVVLDGWVRRGGHVVILADPLLHWPDPRPLGHVARAPLTSLLDPLLSHWELRLEPAEIDLGQEPVERRALASGALLQLAGASRFVPTGRGSCTLAERGLLARCPIGRGSALLIADADWIDDTLWTLNPASPGDRSAWTSDAVDLLSGWLGAPMPSSLASKSWLDGAQLLPAIRVVLVALLLLALMDALVARRPRAFRRKDGMKRDQKRNIGATKLETS